MNSSQLRDQHRADAACDEGLWRVSEGASSAITIGVAGVVDASELQAAKHIGTILKGKWRIEGLLGLGGMASVFAARHRNGRRVAIKCMRPELVVEPALVERFLREGYVANKIAHPGAVAILDDDVMEDGTPFLVMELLDGQTLRQRLEDGPVGLQEALRGIADVLDVLGAAHEKGIVHRDLKPDNLFQTEDGAIKVLDFGIARLKERTRSEYETQSGTTMGTIGFMPPEQARGLTTQVDARSDVWAIGATLFTLLTGRSVHEAQTVNETLLLAMTTPVLPMAELLPSLPSAVQSLLDTALAFTAADRYESAQAMKDALDVARAGLGRTEWFSPPLSRRPAAPVRLTELAATDASPSLVARALSRKGSPRRSGSKAFLLATAVGLLLVLGLGGLAVVSYRGSRPTDAAKPVAADDRLPDPLPSAPAAPASVATAETSSSAKPAPIASSAAAPAKRSVQRLTKVAPPAPPAPLPAPEPSPVETRDPLGIRR